MKRLAMWWRWEGKYYHRDFINGVKNLIKWFPTVWKDRDWDDHFIFEILAKKLEHQSNYIEKRDWHKRAQRDAETMRLVVKLIRLVQDETYGMEYMDYEEKEFHFDAIPNSTRYEMRTELHSERYQEFFDKYPRQYKLLMAGKIDTWGNDIYEMDDSTKARLIAHHNHDRCRKLLFKIMEQNIEGWWD